MNGIKPTLRFASASSQLANVRHMVIKSHTV